jgi:glycosyltransferase involved in cell wall biosynthesis
MSANRRLPSVSAVIPTRNRPELVSRAARSALGQSYASLEVIVVVDGPDPATAQVLEALGDSRLRIVALAENVGGSEARNIGVREAKGEWIALLDDDDEWLPQKIDRQIAAICADNREIVFSATRYFDNRGSKKSIEPRRFPSPKQPICEYLFCETNRFGRRDCFLQTSTWMVRREFLLTHPFTVGLKKNQDTDWLLRAFPQCAGQSAFVAEPLATFHRQPGIQRISTTRDWEYTFQWVEGNRRLFTPRARAFVFMTECARSANRQGAGLRTILFLWKQCDRAAKRSPKLVFCMGIALLHWLACFARRRPRTSLSDRMTPAATMPAKVE